VKILVTGAGGLLGSKLITLLAAQADTELIATARHSLPVPANVSFHKLDITNPENIRVVFDDVRPDVVMNTAAMTQVDDCELNREVCWEQNVVSMKHLTNACDEFGIHLVHVSTDFIFDGSHGPLTEDEKPGPVNYYGESKLEGERIVMKMKGKWAIVRTVLVYGYRPGLNRSNIVLWVKKSLEEGKNIKVVTDQFRTPTLAEDLANGCWLAAKKNATGVYHVSGSEMMTPYEIAIRTADFFKLDKSLIAPTDSTQFKQPAKRPMKTGFVIEKARKELGYKPRSFEEGLRLIAGQMDQESAGGSRQ
jgi:dTDP-4-dehydrorhamnose reductase